MNTIEMLKELVENGGMFHYGDDISIYLKKDCDGGICWFGKETDKCVSSLKLNSTNMNVRWKPYVKPVDWSNVPIDTKVLCKSFKENEWTRRYFAGLKVGIRMVYDNGGTSWSNETWETCAYDEMKLADATE